MTYFLWRNRPKPIVGYYGIARCAKSVEDSIHSTPAVAMRDGVPEDDNITESSSTHLWGLNPPPLAVAASSGDAMCPKQKPPYPSAKFDIRQGANLSRTDGRVNASGVSWARFLTSKIILW